MKPQFTSQVDHHDYIDALRGWAILGVIVVHVSQRFPDLHEPLRRLTAEGARGVQLFFVVSALTLMFSWHKRQDGAVRFFIRRFFRIAPMFWLAILVFLFLNGFEERYWAPSGISYWHVILTALFVHGWHPESINSVVPGGWSIAVEMTFYAIFPAIVRYCTSFWRGALALVCAVVLGWFLNRVASVGWLSSMSTQPKYLLDNFLFFWFWSQLPVFLIGVSTYFAIENCARIPRHWSFALVFTSCTAIVFLPLSGLAPPLPWHIVYSLVFAILALGLSRYQNAALVNPLLCFFGQVSFSAYIWHFAVLDVFDKLARAGFNPFDIREPEAGAPQFSIFLFVVGFVTVSISYITYRFVEQPMIRLGSLVVRTAQRGKSVS